MPTMPVLILRFKKKADADTALVCVRTDGTWTLSKIGPAHGYGPVHDLAHFVVESTFGLTGGFLGLVARGWEMQDFDVGAAARIARARCGGRGPGGVRGGPSLRGGHGGRRTSAEEFNWAVQEMMGSAHTGSLSGAIPADVLAAMRDRLDALRRRWDALAPGETLELRYEPGVAVPATAGTAAFGASENVPDGLRGG